MASETVAIVFAVNWAPQAPAEGHATFSSSSRSASDMSPDRMLAHGLEQVLHRHRAALEGPGRIEPP